MAACRHMILIQVTIHATAFRLNPHNQPYAGLIQTFFCRFVKNTHKRERKLLRIPSKIYTLYGPFIIQNSIIRCASLRANHWPRSWKWWDPYGSSYRQHIYNSYNPETKEEKDETAVIHTEPRATAATTNVPHGRHSRKNDPSSRRARESHQQL